jgi:hypothetical protein
MRRNQKRVRLGMRHGLASHRRRWIELNCCFCRVVRRADPLLYSVLARICGCEAAPAPARVVPAAGLEARRDPATEELLAARVAVVRAPARAGFRLNDLVFPRRAACERFRADGKGQADQGDAPVEAHLRDLEQGGFRASLYQALRVRASMRLRRSCRVRLITPPVTSRSMSTGGGLTWRRGARKRSAYQPPPLP